MYHLCRAGAVSTAIGSAKFFDTSSHIQPVEQNPLHYSQETSSQAFILFAFAIIVMAISGFFGQHDEAEVRRGVPQAPKNFALYGGDIGEGVLFSYAAALAGERLDQSVLLIGVCYSFCGVKKEREGCMRCPCNVLSTSIHVQIYLMTAILVKLHSIFIGSRVRLAFNKRLNFNYKIVPLSGVHGATVTGRHFMPPQSIVCKSGGRLDQLCIM